MTWGSNGTRHCPWPFEQETIPPDGQRHCTSWSELRSIRPGCLHLFDSAVCFEGCLWLERNSWPWVTLSSEQLETWHFACLMKHTSVVTNNIGQATQQTSIKVLTDNQLSSLWLTSCRKSSKIQVRLQVIPNYDSYSSMSLRLKTWQFPDILTKRCLFLFVGRATLFTFSWSFW